METVYPAGARADVMPIKEEELRQKKDEKYVVRETGAARLFAGGC